MKGSPKRSLKSAAVSHWDDTDPTVLRDYYQSLLDSVGSVIYTVDRDLCITGVNQRWDAFALANSGAHLTGEHILGTSLLDQMTGAALNRWRSVCRQLLDGRLAHYLDEVVSEEPSTWRNFSLRATPLRDSQGEILGITFVATDITQLKKAEHEMFQRLIEIRGLSQVARTTGTWVDRRRVFKQVTTDIAHLFDAEKCVIFLWDEHTGNLQAREPAFGLAGRKLADLSLDMGHPADPDSLWQDMEEKDYILLNEGTDAPADMVETSSRVDRLAAMLGILRVSARIHGAILAAGRGRPFTDQDGQLMALFAVPIALSIENVELNRRLLDRTQQLTTTREQLDRVLNIKETIRRPLGVMRGYLELLRDGTMGPVREEQRPTIDMVLDKTQTIISQISGLSAPRLPHDATHYERIFLGDLVRIAVDRRLPSGKDPGVELVTELPALRDEESTIVGDPEMLLTVFDALLYRAMKTSPEGSTLRVSLRASDDIVYVEIADSGPGIPADELPDLWQAEKPTSPSDPISLAEVKRIVEGHGGQIWAESTPGQGNSFHVALQK